LGLSGEGFNMKPGLTHAAGLRRGAVIADRADARRQAPVDQSEKPGREMSPKMLSALALAYCRHSPIDFGKSRLSQLVAPYVGRCIATIRTSDKFRMRVDTQDFIQRTIYLTGVWDEGVAGAVRRVLKPGELFVDVGANVGYFSLLAAQRGARVIAFEPNPECREELAHNIALNGFGDIDVRATGIADRRGQDVLYVESEENLGAGSLKSVSGTPVAVEVDTLDGQLAGESPAMIKLDIEGAELMALRGGAQTLKRTRAVICEVSEFSLRELGGSKEELFATMAEHGFICEIVSPVRRSTHSQYEISFQYDVLFTKRDRTSD
jgi:FkbM family methyltransferase